MKPTESPVPYSTRKSRAPKALRPDYVTLLEGVYAAEGNPGLIRRLELAALIGEDVEAVTIW